MIPIDYFTTGSPRPSSPIGQTRHSNAADCSHKAPLASHGKKGIFPFYTLNSIRSPLMHTELGQVQLKSLRAGIVWVIFTKCSYIT